MTNHTEALFLLLSILALTQAFRKNLVLASVFAGLAAVTRNQGVLLSIAVGLVFLFRHDQTWKVRLRQFVVSGAISASFYAAWVFYGYLNTGVWFISIDSQKYWDLGERSSHYLRNLLWLSPNNGFRALLMWSVIVVAVRLLTQARHQHKDITIPIAFYLLTSVALWPTQGNNFGNAYRYSTVLFPFWIILADQFERFLHSPSTIKRGAAIAGGIWLVGSACALSYRYFNQTWAY